MNPRPPDFPQGFFHLSPWMDDTDRKLLTLLQHEIPLRTRPFEILGEKVGIDGAEVLLRISRLKNQQIIRNITGIFDSRKFGYKSLQVAMLFPDERVEQAARILNRYPEVIYSCTRNHFLNFWFTLAAEASAPLIERAKQLQGIVRPVKARIFSNLQVFKSSGSLDGTVPLVSGPARNFTEAERSVIRFLQDDLPLTDEPFKKIAQQTGISEKKVFETLEGLSRDRIFKRVSAFLYSREFEFSVQALVAWQVPEEKMMETGMQMAMFEEVAHCVARPADDEFPHGLHTLIQVPALSILPEVISRIESRAGKWPRQILLTEKEYKKVRLKYFSKEPEAGMEESPAVPVSRS